MSDSDFEAIIILCGMFLSFFLIWCWLYKTGLSYHKDPFQRKEITFMQSIIICLKKIFLFFYMPFSLIIWIIKLFSFKNIKKYISFIGLLFNKISSYLEKHEVQRFSLIIIFIGICLYLLNHNSNNVIYYMITIAFGVILFLSTFSWVWILGIASIGYYFGTRLIDNLNHSLFGDALINLMGVIAIFIILKPIFYSSKLRN